MMGLFGKTPELTPKEMVNDWSRKIRKEGYQLDRQIRAIQREEDKVKRSLKEAAKKGDKDICLILAKEVLRARKAVNKIHISKAHMQSILLQMKNQLGNVFFFDNAGVTDITPVLAGYVYRPSPHYPRAGGRAPEFALVMPTTLRVAGSLQKSTEVMQAIQNLVKVPEVSETMRELSREMMKAGIIEEMLDDTMDNLDEEDLEEEADGEVDKVLWELTAGALGRAPAAVTDSLPPQAAGAKAASTSTPVAHEDEEELEEMQSRLEALRSDSLWTPEPGFGDPVPYLRSVHYTTQDGVIVLVCTDMQR
ncbi:hypothetical protein PR048_033585 [Dryococelus australis]|uniref:Charged multivesicular body protein 3 n=1 Tax=Dryococelus australis TaxID=614101 RepID=A0ABQ9G0Q4_9NEOP|nr:hypothetical protein PR048_033585 [Dryococelus australis]